MGTSISKLLYIDYNTVYKLIKNPTLNNFYQVDTICSSYGELFYNITLFGEDKVTNLLTTQSIVCSRVCNVTLLLSGPGDYQFELHAVNNRGTSDPVIRNFTISGKISARLYVHA